MDMFKCNILEVINTPEVQLGWRQFMNHRLRPSSHPHLPASFPFTSLGILSWSDFLPLPLALCFPLICLLIRGTFRHRESYSNTPTAPTHAGLVNKVTEWNYIQLAQSTFFICVGNYFWLSHLTHPVQVHLDFKTLGSTGKSFRQWKEVWCKRKDSTLRIRRLGV